MISSTLLQPFDVLQLYFLFFYFFTTLSFLSPKIFFYIFFLDFYLPFSHLTLAYIFYFFIFPLFYSPQDLYHSYYVFFLFLLFSFFQHSALSITLDPLDISTYKTHRHVQIFYSHYDPRDSLTILVTCRNCVA